VICRSTRSSHLPSPAYSGHTCILGRMNVKEKILLVDDEEGIRKVLGISLSDKGYDVFTAQDGEGALRLFKETKPSVVLTDIKMPGMDGIELLGRLKKEDPDTEVIMITGHGEMDLAIKSLKYEATDFVTKPINDDVLEIALKRAYEKISMKRQLRDYTQNLEKLVKEQSAKLVETERAAAVGQTVAGLAHAIKNIAGGLRGGVFVVEKGMELGNDEYLRQGWDMVKTDVARIRAMALDLLNYAKERKPDYKLYDPNGVAREVLVLMGPRAKEYGVALEADLDEDLPDVWFDPEGMHRCLTNLVTNAIDACADITCAERDGRVVLKSFAPGNEQYRAGYEVADNGCGITEEMMPKLFQSFFSTKGTKGTGLGLMTTKKIIDEHGGDIAVQSDPGKGTQFVIRFAPMDHTGAASEA